MGFAKEKIFIRNIEGERYFEILFVSAISSIIFIRAYLYLTGYPQIGGGGLHIAHMLWGGLGMLIAMILTFGFLSRTLNYVAAIVGGIGFGTFIDELGKFITKDNNYFFQPTIAIIYVFFVALYLLLKFIERHSIYSPYEYLLNSLEVAKDAVIDDFDESEKRLAMKYLHESKEKNQLEIALREFIQKLNTIEPPNPSRLNLVLSWIRELYLALAKKVWFNKLIVAVFVLQALFTILVIFVFFFDIEEFRTFSLIEDGEVITSVVSGLLVLLGIATLRRSKIKGYKMFEISVLVSIFLTQPFIFYEAQLSAIYGLSLDLLLLTSVNYMISQEQISTT